MPLLLAQEPPGFAGIWKQDDARCVPKRTGDVTLRIEQQPPSLSVETTIVRLSAAPRHALQRYSTDGKESVSTGADGDEFHTSIVVRDGSLVFTVVEHEDGRILHSSETWTLIDEGSALKRVREGEKAETPQTLIYTRVQP